MKSKFPFSLMLIGITLIACADNSDHKILGSWKCDQGFKYTSTITFLENATYREIGSNEGIRYDDNGRWNAAKGKLIFKSRILPTSSFDYQIVSDTLFLDNMKIEDNIGDPSADSFIFVRLK